MVLMMNPRVGLTVLTSSFMILFTIVVLPALSKPLIDLSVICSCQLKLTHSISIRISLSFRRAFRRIDNILLDLLMSQLLFHCKTEMCLL